MQNKINSTKQSITHYMHDYLQDLGSILDISVAHVQKFQHDDSWPY